MAQENLNKDDTENEDIIIDFNKFKEDVVQEELKTPELVLEQSDLHTNIYDPRPEDDKARRRITYGLVILLSSVLLIMLATFIFFDYQGKNTSNLEKLSTILLTPLITIVSSAIGYYFGSQSNK
ncbi:MAG: hypothetical protein RLZZ210_1833 [Pseudomonadota bacterium]|jgi:hypothetical protein